MEKLRELVNIVRPIKTFKIELVGNSSSNNLTNRLYKGLVASKYSSDKEAAIDLYGPNFSPNTYAQLKRSLTKKLINTLFFIDVSDIELSDFQKKHIEAHRQRTAIIILLSRGGREMGIDLAEKVLKKSLLYEFTDISFELSRLLLRHYRTHNINAAKEKYYKSIVDKSLALILKETEVENAYGLAMKELANERTTNEYKAKSLSKYVKQLNKIFPKSESYKIAQFYYWLLALSEESKNNHEVVVKVCQSAISYFEKKKVVSSKAMIGGFYMKLLGTFIALREFEAGSLILDKVLKTVIDGGINWFITMDYYFLLSMHTDNYKKALEIFKEVTSHKAFKPLTPEYKELWRIYQAYLSYLQAVGLLEKEDGKRFRVAKFVNQVPIFSRDKKGVNVAIIIIQILFMIAQRKQLKVIDKIDALRMYVHTHLRNDDSLRSNIFIKMLIKMAKANFNKQGTIRQTKTLYEKLKVTPMTSKALSQFVEIIPYEKLREISFSQLGKRPG